jgi:hypothetical protein
MTPANANQANVDDCAPATALSGVVVRGVQNLLAESAAPGSEGARAALETFYHAFNIRSLALYQLIWADYPLVQVDSPLAGMIRGSATIAALAERGFSGLARVQTVLEDIVAYATPELAVFTGRERGAYTPDGEQEALSEIPGFNSISVFRYIADQGGWRLVYHSVWLHDAE